MTITAVNELDVQQMLDAGEELTALAKQVAIPSGDGERRIMLVPLSKEGAKSYLEHMRRIMEECNRQFREAIERFRMLAELAHAEVQRVMKHRLHRTQRRTSSTGKNSAKKSASSSGSSGGDGGSDGDGPHRNRLKQKSRSSQNRHTRPQRPPNSPPGAIANTSPQSLRPKPPHGPGLILSIVVILLIFVVVLLVMGEREMAWSVLGPLSATLITYVKRSDQEG